MIFVKISTRKINNLDPKKESPRIAKIKDEDVEYKAIYHPRIDNGDFIIHGEGGHTKPYGTTMEEDYDRREETDDFDSWSELTIKLEKTEILEICKRALNEKIIKLHDILCDEKRQELTNSCETIRSEVDKITSDFAGESVKKQLIIYNE
jgi:hypothetical protein